ncbi:MAG: hypothetical protein M3281_10030 [Chloroflexota bacterium]|nr:hypothetical protein [Chloroflexota bacterium]
MVRGVNQMGADGWIVQGIISLESRSYRVEFLNYQLSHHTSNTEQGWSDPQLAGLAAPGDSSAATG